MAPKGRGEEDYVSQSQVQQLIEQQKLFYKDLLDQQERNYQNFLKIMIEANNKRLDEITREVDYVKPFVIHKNMLMNYGLRKENLPESAQN